jgi:aminoglycoside phosphotransferase (APT) family kinase protein
MLIDFDHYFQAPLERPLLSNAEIQALVLHLQKGQQIIATERLEGGYRNQNYRVQCSQNQVVLRVSQNQDAGLKELALLKQLSQFLPVPKVLAQRQTSAHLFALLEYVEGLVPTQLPSDLNESSYASLGSAIGATLARIHQVVFEHAGFLNAQLQILEPTPQLGDTWLAYMREVLHGLRAEERLGKDLCQASLNLLTQKEGLLRELDPINRLVHADFNLKNLLVQEKDGFWRVRAVLDWEFAHAGSPLVDIGNFFRFENDLPMALFEGFLQTYQDMAGPLPHQWRAQAYLLDLAAMCNFLDAPESKPITLNTVKRVFKDTLQYFEAL